MIRTTHLLTAALTACAVLGAACMLPQPSQAQDAPLAEARDTTRDVARAVRDVEVMRRILAKEALGATQTAHGAYLLANAFYSDSSLVGNGSAEAFFVEGQGAVFLLRTADAVTPSTPEKSEPQSEPETLWDRTVADVEGRPRRNDPRVVRLGAVFDAEKVRALEDRVLEQFAKFGPQMSEIRRGETVVVIVTGGARATTDLTVSAVEALSDRDDPVASTVQRLRVRPGRTVRTICIRMSDIHDVARSNGGAAALRERATIRAF
jgi:hypothetical protein